MDWIDIQSPITLSVQTDKRGYAIGEPARIAVTASARVPWSGEIALGIYDFRGRLLHAANRPISLSEQPLEVDSTWQVENHGVRVDVFGVQVAARRDGAEWQRTETRFYKYEPWSTRNEYQWSTWSGIACGPPCTVPAGMRLMAHAGMNALGYPGRNEIFYPAERWGWRYYNENIGVNTFAPVIDYENDAEIEAAVRKEIEDKRDRRDLYSAAYVLGSVGEEAGFKHGWGTRYYWDTPVAPEKANRAFQWFLREKYASLADLNRDWGTNFGAWDQIKLARELSPGRGGRLVDFDADGWAHPKETPLGDGVDRISLAPVADTGEFYSWYYDRIIVAAKRCFREEVNPVTQVMASAPTIGTPDVYDVRGAGPSAWNESQWHALLDGPEPGFGLIWGHFDWNVKTDNMFWGWLLTRSGHNNYWVDVPLMFNNDMTHTRASFAMRQWTSRLAGHERIILDSRPAPTDVGILSSNGLFHDTTRQYMADSIRVAASQAGFALPREDPTDFDQLKILFAVARQEVSPREAERLEQFVRNGGTLVITSQFSRRVAAQWDLQLHGGRVPRHHPRTQLRFSPGEPLDEQPAGFQVATWTVFRETVDQQGWDQWAAYEDGTPAILARGLGQGRMVYVNAVYNSHYYIQWVTPTGPDRQGFFKLIESLCAQAGARRSLRIDGPPAETLHMAVKQFTDPTGQIRFAIVRTSGEVPWTSGTLHWLDPHEAGYDVLRGESFGKTVPLNLRPGAGRLLAFLPRAVAKIRLDVSPPQIHPGQLLTLTAHVLDANDRPIQGAFPFELRVAANGTELPGLARSFSATSGQAVTVHTALSDPAGLWQVRITDGITGRAGATEVTVVVPAADTQTRPGGATREAPRFIPWGWPSEIEETATIPADDFLSRLLRLKEVYLAVEDAHPWLPKQRFGYYYDFFPGTRHALLRPLLDVDWRDHGDAWRAAIEQGATFVLTGEDLGLSPDGGRSIYAHHDAHQIDAIINALSEARWSLATRDGDTLAATLGVGRVILCRESIDAAGHDNPSIVAWQRRWLGELEESDQPPRTIPPPSADHLRNWWIGAASITDLPRTVTWLEGNARELTLELNPNDELGKSFAFVLPPQGRIVKARVDLQMSGTEPIHVDIGCDGSTDADVGSDGTLDWTNLLSGYDAEYRDGSQWRIIPVRLRSEQASQVVIGSVVLTLENSPRRGK